MFKKIIAFLGVFAAFLGTYFSWKSHEVNLLSLTDSHSTFSAEKPPVVEIKSIKNTHNLVVVELENVGESTAKNVQTFNILVRESGEEVDYHDSISVHIANLEKRQTKGVHVLEARTIRAVLQKEKLNYMALSEFESSAELPRIDIWVTYEDIFGKKYTKVKKYKVL